MNGLKQFRKEKELSQLAMARQMEITLSMYQKVESGRARPSYAFMERLKRAFPDANIDALFFSHIRGG